MGEFRMNTGVVHAAGGNIQKLADEFGYDKNKIDQIVDGIVSSDYTSDDARTIANEIKSFGPMLNNIHARLERHGAFGINASRQTLQTQEDIISSAKRG